MTTPLNSHRTAGEAAPLVSVILCVHNGARYLRGALASARSQTYSPIEIIAVDDGSTDDTPEILASVPGIRRLHQSNSGASRARNLALPEARGAYISFIDHDDEWFPDKTARQVEFLQQHPDIAIVACHARTVLEIARPPWLPEAHVREPQPCLLPSALLIRAEVFAAVGGYDPQLRRAEDYDWLIRAGRAGWRRHVLPVPLLARRVHEGNQTHDRVGGRRELFRALAAKPRAAAGGAA